MKTSNVIEKNVNVKLKYISSACNRVSHCLDWGNNNLVCFGANNAVAIYDLGVLPFGQVKQTLHHHKQKVTTVQWIKTDQNDETQLISGSTDGTAVIYSSTDRFKTFHVEHVLDTGEPVSVCTTISKGDELVIFVSSINGNCQIWTNQLQKVSLQQSFNLNKKLVLEAKMCILPDESEIILAVALEDATICLLAKQEADFVPMTYLIGHEDWVTCLDFTINTDSKQVLLASGSQDHFIRLWTIAKHSGAQESAELQVKKQILQLSESKYEVTLESVLCGHSGWIYGLHWYNENNRMQLLSASLDKSMIIWEYDCNSGIWTEKIRVGDVGGNSLGYYGCRFGQNGSSILTHGFFGSLYRWQYSADDDNWIPLPACTGHFAEVVDLFWDKHGRYLVTTSADQTTRIHAPWILQDNECWYEISRPQIHGYNMSCITAINATSFASGAEEKVVRIFVAPLTFHKYIASISTCNKQYAIERDISSDDMSFEIKLFKNLKMEDEGENEMMADSASVPALGLTNKAVFNKDQREEQMNGSSSVLNYSRPPLEEELVEHTLWPEVEKLYGHGYELFAMAATNDAQLLASACKSTSHEHAAIILWSTKTWSQVQKLHFHQLTVTQLEFSPDDKYLLSVSRDRLWALYERTENGLYKLSANMKKNCLHKRIIWCCSWLSDSQHFATGSRDGLIGIWNVNHSDDYGSIDTKGESVTALSLAQVHQSHVFHLLAVGFESGCIQLYIANNELKNWTAIVTLNTSMAHHLTVKRLKFRPFDATHTTLCLASCASDNAVKIYEIDLTRLLKDDVTVNNLL